MHADAHTLQLWTMIDLALVLGVGVGVGALCVRVRQPAVVGELLAGLLLGPSLLGAWQHNPVDDLFPAASRPTLDAIAHLGVVLFVFFVALEMDVGAIRRSGRTTVAIATGSLVVPLAFGTGLGVLLARSSPSVGHDARSVTVFAVFIGLALCVTAFPVLARILGDLGERDTGLGAQSLSAAGLVDLVAWLGVTVLASMASTRSHNALVTAAVLLAIWLGVRYAVGPLLVLALRRAPAGHPGWVTPILIALALASAAAAEVVGTDAVFGALLLGLALPRELVQRDDGAAMRHIETIALFLVPVFFVAVGLGMDLRVLQARGWGEFGVIFVVAVSTKFVGTYLGARIGRRTPREATVLGLLMNTRGLTEVVIVQIGVSAGILPPRYAACLILLALVTTGLAMPTIHLLLGRGTAGSWPAVSAPGAAAVAAQRPPAATPSRGVVPAQPRSVDLRDGRSLPQPLGRTQR